MTLTDFRIDTGFFGGPLDLLLHLVRRHELDICRVSLSRITEEFVEYLQVLQLLDLDLIGEFIVTASILLEIKSREVLPRTDPDPDDVIEEDVSGSELIRRLLEYRRFKAAAAQLEERAAQWLERYPRLSDDRPPADDERPRQRIRGVEIWDLVSALARLVRLPDAVEQTTIRMDETPLAVHQEQIRRSLESCDRVAFSAFFGGEKNPSRIVGIFQAILELIRHEGYRAIQEDPHPEIWILPPAAQTTAAQKDPAA